MSVRTDDDSFFEDSKHMTKQHKFAETNVNRQVTDDTTKEREVAVVWVHLTCRQ